MQFIVDHQAKHEVEMQQIREIVKGLAKNQAHLQQTVKDLTRDQSQLKQAVRGVVAIVGDSARHVADLARESRKLSQEQRRDRADLRALTNVVGKLVRRNGRDR